MALSACAPYHQEPGKIANWKDMRVEGKLHKRTLLNTMKQNRSGYLPSRDIMVYRGIYPNTFLPFVMPFP